MIVNLVDIGNSRGIRIPKIMLVESGIEDEVELKVKKGEIKIVAISKKDKSNINTMQLSEKSLSVDWDKPEEDEAWASLQ
jgi:antitoxin component of MazEF toxin-antitoxin module